MKKRICRHCVNAGRVRNGDPDELICANCPLAPGELVRVRPDEACPNFRAKRRPPLRLPPPEPPNDKIRYIPLTRGLFAIVDAADYPELSKYRWCATVCRKSTYASRREKGKTVLMHRQIMQPPPGMVVDHIDHNGLDNRRENLRICTPRQNQWNTGARGGRAGYKGVSHNRKTGRYEARIKFDGRPIRLGSFDDPAEAARARDRKARELQGPYAYINLPDDLPPEPDRPDPNHPQRPLATAAPCGPNPIIRTVAAALARQSKAQMTDTPVQTTNGTNHTNVGLAQRRRGDHQ